MPATTKASRNRRTTYHAAGVNLSAADALVQRIAPLVRSTYGPRVLDGHGGFSGAFRLDYD
ncbi:MAG: phosphoribosylformylglycinamidine cyclo-ligase, partial [Planctomycetes bacterium]|nr:phosphoribosylformylglycinamidine cyclo-ligase [Planctomycetota bacterium]